MEVRCEEVVAHPANCINGTAATHLASVHPRPVAEERAAGDEGDEAAVRLDLRTRPAH